MPSWDTITGSVLVIFGGGLALHAGSEVLESKEDWPIAEGNIMDCIAEPARYMCVACIRSVPKLKGDLQRREHHSERGGARQVFDRFLNSA